MALFSMRDSWNVWRRKVNESLGGLVEPVKSEDVTYDNTDSGLTATNVQSAIDEVIDNVYKNYAIKTINADITVTADGTKSVKNLMDEISALFLSAISNLDTNEYILPNRLTLAGYADMGAIGKNYVAKGTTSFNLPFARISVFATNAYEHYAIFGDAVSTDNALKVMKFMATPAITITDAINEVPANKTKFVLKYDIIKQL